MPEMKGRYASRIPNSGRLTHALTYVRTLEEIDELFTNRVSVWKFPSYQTTIGSEAAREVEENAWDEKVPRMEARERVNSSPTNN